MPERETDRRRERDRTQPLVSPSRHDANPVLALQRSIGNRAVAQMLARAPAGTATGTGTVHIHGVGAIKVTGGNLEDWTGKDAPETVDVTSHKGKHSAKLEKMSTERTKTDVKVTISPANKSGEELSVGGGTELEITGARIKDYAVAGGVETWQLADFTGVHRTKITHKVS
jgi:hypothetical protein